MIKAAHRLAGTLHTNVRTIQELLEGLVRLAEVEEPAIALPLLAATLHTFESEEFQETDLSRVNDLSPKIRPGDPDAPGDTVTEELAGRGLQDGELESAYRAVPSRPCSAPSLP